MNILDDMSDLFKNLVKTYGRKQVAKNINRSTGWVSSLTDGNHVLSINEDFINGLHLMGYDILLTKIEKTDEGKKQYRPVRFKNSGNADKERYNDLV